MGLLLRPNGDLFALRARTLIGRGPHCDLRLHRPEVSTEHAVMRWTGTVWELRDLASRNGTRLNGEAIGLGRRVVGPGDTLCFGPSDEPFILREVDPPATWAVALDGGPSRAAWGEMLALPSEEEAQAIVTLDGSGRWVLEQADSSRPLDDREVVAVGGRRFLICLAGPSDGTLDEEPGQLILESLGLRFRVSRDEEHVEIDILHRGGALPLGPRNFHYALLVLARARLADQLRGDLPPAEQGWLGGEALQRMLKIDGARLSVDLYRARKQLAEMGVDGAQLLIERRPESRQLRIAVARLEIAPLT